MITSDVQNLPRRLVSIKFFRGMLVAPKVMIRSSSFLEITNLESFSYLVSR